jgi:hypothetical protein
MTPEETEQGVQLALELLRLRHMRPTDEELAAMDERDLARERPADGICLDVHDAGDDPGVIPPREWLLGNQFCCGFISSIVAAGGAGKSALRLLQFISLATGRPLCGQHVFRRCRVLLISLEDDLDELKRRIAAVLLHYGIPRSELKGWLFYAAPKLTKLAEMKDRARAVGPLVQQIREALERYEPDLVSLDPFIKTHGLEENDNVDMDFVCDLLAHLAIEFNIAVDSPHHVHKGQIEPGNADAGRGASGIKDAGRLVYTLVPMSEPEAKIFGIDPENRRTYVRLDSAKVNIAAPSGRAEWFHLIGVPIGNGSKEYPNGDTIQVVEPWEPPKTWADISNDDIDRILTIIDAGLSDGNLYSDASAATKRAAWKVVHAVVPEKTETQCREIIRTWVEKGVLVKTSYENPKNRNEEHGLKLGPEKREELDNRAKVQARKAEAEAKAERRKRLEPLAAVLNAWKAAIGVGERRPLAHVIEMAAAKINPDLNAAFLAVAPMDDGKTISNVLLARWLRDFNEVPIDGLMLSGGGVDEAGSPWWMLVPANQKEPPV